MIIVMIIIIIILITTTIIVNHFPLFVLRLFFIFSFFGWSTASWKVTVKSSHLIIIITTTTTTIIITFLKQLCLWVTDTPTLKATPSSFSFAASPPSRDQSAVAGGGPPRSACPVVAVAAIACGQLAAAEAGTDRMLRLQPRLSPGQRWLKAAGPHSRSQQ